MLTLANHFSGTSRLSIQDLRELAYSVRCDPNRDGGASEAVARALESVATLRAARLAKIRRHDELKAMSVFERVSQWAVARI
ncbi:hypothetical protein BH11PSE13_BH11PSE13_45510 [soil metagenome]